MSEAPDRGIIISAEIVAEMRKQASDSVKIQEGLGGIIEGMTEVEDVEGLKRIRALYGDEVCNMAVELHRRLAV